MDLKDLFSVIQLIFLARVFENYLNKTTIRELMMSLSVTYTAHSGLMA